MKQIKDIDFEELTVYEWVCPECGACNRRDEIENFEYCDSCNEDFEVVCTE